MSGFLVVGPVELQGRAAARLVAELGRTRPSSRGRATSMGGAFGEEAGLGAGEACMQVRPNGELDFARTKGMLDARGRMERR